MPKLYLFLFLLLPVQLSDFISNDELFVVVTTENAETQMMAMVLATQSYNRGVSVSILLCSDGGLLAVKGESSPSFAPSNRSPKLLLQSLLSSNIEVNVCGIFLPSREITEGDLLDGVGVASPADIAEYMAKPGIRYFTF